MGSCLSMIFVIQLIGVMEGDEEQELTQKHCLVGTLTENPANYP